MTAALILAIALYTACLVYELRTTTKRLDAINARLETTEERSRG